MVEEFKDILGYSGRYKVSNKGNIKSFVRYPEGKLMSPKLDKDLYCEIGLRDGDGIRKFMKIHNIVASHFIDNPNNYHIVNHKDNNPSNNESSNLEWCTIEYNNQYRFTNGNASHKGIKHPMASLTEEQVIQIYKLGTSGEYTEPSIAKMFNTTRSVVNKIRLKQRWTHITDMLHKGASGMVLNYEQFTSLIKQ